MADKCIRAALLGHSHIGAIAQAIASRGIDALSGRPPLYIYIYDVWKNPGQLPYMKNINGKVCFNTDILDSFHSKCMDGDERHIFTTFGGNEHNTFSLIEGERPAELVFSGDWKPSLSEDVEILPVNFARAILGSFSSEYDEQLRQLRAATTDRIHRIEPPPPLEDRDHILMNLDEFFRNSNKLPKISENNFRKNIWKIQCDMQKDLCRELDINYIENSKSVMTNSGFLKREFYSGDATHANKEYGISVLNEIESTVGAVLHGWSIFL